MRDLTSSYAAIALDCGVGRTSPVLICRRAKIRSSRHLLFAFEQAIDAMFRPGYASSGFKRVLGDLRVRSRTRGIFSLADSAPTMEDWCGVCEPARGLAISPPIDTRAWRMLASNMRTTVTFDDQTYELVKQRARETGRTIREVLNEAVRLGLQIGAQRSRQEVHLTTYPMGLKRGYNYDNIGELLERLDGPLA